MKKIFKLLALAVLLLCSLWADLTVTYGTKATEINMGQNKAVLVFDVAGSDTFTGISLRNDSDVPFYKYGVDRVELRSGVDNDGSGGSSIASKAFATNELPATELNLSFSPPAGAGRYAVIYNISAEAKKYTPKDSSSYVYAKAYLTGVATANGTYEPTDTGFSNVDVVVWAAGLINLPDKVKNMLQSNNIVAPDSLVPMLTFTLRAEGYPATINYVSISSSGNFATDQTNGDEMVKEVILLADEDGIGDYGGLSRENIVCRLDLTTSHTGDHDEIKLSLNQVVTLSAYATSGGISNKQVSEKKFWVLYRLGKGIPRDTQLSCSLIGGNAGELRGDFPVGNVSTVVKDYDARLISVVPADAYNVVSGERGIKMLEFSYDVKHEIKDVTLEIYNGGGTFAPRNSDKGVNRVYLYKKNVNDNTLLAVGDISSTSNSICIFRGITLEAGVNTYNITYDTGIKLAQGDALKAQLYAVSAPNTAFSGYLPAPEQYTPLPVYPSIIWVDFVSTNVSTVRPGDTFKVDIGVRNIMGGEDGPSLGQSPLYLIPGTTPVFYTKDVGFYTYSLGGKDITSEFHIQPDFNYPVSISAVYAQATTLSFSVTAANLKTNGTVYIDANPVYEVNYNPQLTNLPDVYYRAYFDDSNMLVPAARNWQQQDLPGYAVINLQGSGADINNSNGDINKSYVDSLELIGQDSDYNRKFQTATKLEIPGRTKLIVQLSPGSDFDKDRFVIYVNEQPYRPGSGTGAEYNYDENLGSIELIIGDPNIAGFSGTGTVLISGYAADSLLHGSIGLITLNYTIMNSSEFKVSNTLPYPSPYNPDNGDLSIGFDCTRAGVEYSVHIYDVSGREVFKETGLTTALGYNRYSWDGKFAAGGIVGRGAYVTRLHFKGYDKQDVVTKFGVK